MILNDQAIWELADRQKLITPFSFDSLGGHSYDCHLAGTIQIPEAKKKGKAVIKTWRSASLEDDEAFFLAPGQFVLGSTIESLSLPADLIGVVYPKFGLCRCGLRIGDAGLINANFTGTLTVPIRNDSPWPIELIAKKPVFQIVFMKVDRAKHGRLQRGLISTDSLQ